MELKTFAEDDFDPKKWINRVWSNSGNQEKEIFVTNTVQRLQLYMKQLTNSLDETTTQVVTSIPHVLQDALALQMEGALLHEKVLALEQKVQEVEEETGHSIESLQRIDQLKSRLENAASALREADKWAALATKLEDVLESGVPTQKDKLDELSELVVAMTASLEVLSDAPDYDSKKMQLETLYNRLEASISPPLIEAITQMDADRAAIYVKLFCGMSRTVSVCRCWRRAAAARMASSWRRLDAHTVPALSRLLTGEANKQVDWLTNVLKSETPLAELIRLYTDLLLSLDPSPAKIVSASLKLCSNPEEGVILLTDLRQDINEFVNFMKGIMEAPKQNKESILPATVRELGRAAYAPLRDSLPKYAELQTQLLLANLNDSRLDNEEDLLEHSRAILQVADRCDGWLSSSYNGAKKIGGIAIYPFYMPAVEAFVSAISNRISSHSRRIESEFLSSVTAGVSTGVLSNTFPASLVLETATATVLDTLAERQKSEVEEEQKESHPLVDLPTLLLDSETRQRLSAIRSEPPGSTAALRRSREHLRSLAKSILRHPVELQLDKISQLAVWSNNDALSTDLPDFAISPQEYITEIGQYLMTLPQHLELHLSEKQAPWQFLTDVCNHTCETYADKIMNIKNMDALGTKRCLTDIVYLSSVVEDLGSSVTPALKNLENSLRAATPALHSQN
ncbi:conserved oligomeric Golgi complex subunit 7 isoform X1 [Bombyx mori]|uniref:Conserved oligomeric Golgi complex subunit 7 n=1 Tax=Bombyx mori TaxID=7091 RepID=A0A8R2R3F6_BOMMO|nr:conserved oligomeric Golgi complex subunit 7 [Bombyx mori]